MSSASSATPTVTAVASDKKRPGSDKLHKMKFMQRVIQAEQIEQRKEDEDRAAREAKWTLAKPAVKPKFIVEYSSSYADFPTSSRAPLPGRRSVGAPAPAPAPEEAKEVVVVDATMEEEAAAEPSAAQKPAPKYAPKTKAAAKLLAGSTKRKSQEGGDAAGAPARKRRSQPGGNGGSKNSA
ncbi:hypothetical protein AMAG_10261 [Allomyces macrogynus ATCC 38327]|uniref:Uncharacterized protein n=1 Tax=Allomyces macrogynus (strain ATCC 38327) TaxID=578462 RepID=A0A0L0SUD3_ALLM3|nr:hypothetical protein AMAG_10261 [Allomyces macrogynus ATCC 38327]|eukprot:KNE65980.1 hypothetical protein AMAG_10261 [Allomyces macrogynus ATCC 38327]